MKRKRIIAALLAIILSGGCTAAAETSDISSTETITTETAYEDDSYDDTSAVHITLNGDDADIDGTGVQISDSVITITQAGTYVLSGTWSGSVQVNSSSSQSVRLILNGVSIQSSDGPAIYVQKAENTIITLAEGTTNSISDTADYSDQSEDATNAALWSKDDLIINGQGSLTVNGNYRDGITSRDTVYIMNGNITIQAEDDGITARDAFYMEAGILSITSGGDGIKTTNEDKGTLEVKGGTINIIAGDDGIQTVSDVTIDDGTVNIKTTGTNIDEKSKGFSITGSFTLNGGVVTIDSSDDAINTSDDLAVNEGTLTINAGDDAMHADDTLAVNGGSINIQSSYEGLEAMNIVLNDGDITVNASDDGINTADPNVQGSMQADSSLLTIHGGNITVNADGDGIDMNGSGTMDGGTVTVYGPERDMDGALDCNGTFTVSDGTLAAGGSSGMPDFPADSSEAYTIVIGTNGGAVTIQDASGNTIASYTSDKSYSLLSITSDQINQGETYSIIEDGTSIGTVTIEDKISYVNYSSNNRSDWNMGGGPMGRGQGV